MFKRIKLSIQELIEIFAKKRVYRYGAAFSYYVTLSFFPFIILVSIMVAPLQIHLENVPEIVSRFIPSGIIDVFLTHLSYINTGESKVMMWSAIIMLVTSASAAFRVLMDIMADIHSESRYSGFVGFIVSLIMALAVLVFIYLICILILAGRWVLNLMEQHFYISVFADIWVWFRYVLMFPLMFILIQSIYIFTTPKNDLMFHQTIGAMTATVVAVLVSMGFSWLISQTNRYTMIYGSLASVVILMIWLFVLGVVLIMGNALNVVIERRRIERIQATMELADDLEDNEY